MDYRAFYKALEAGALPSALLFCGEEEYIKAAALAALRAKLLPEGMEALNETVMEGAVSAASLSDVCETLPFMADKRLVIVKDSPLVMSAQAGREAGEDVRVVEVIKNLSAATQLVFYAAGNIDARKRVPQLLKGEATVTFGFLEESELHAWISQEAKRMGVAIAPQARALLVSMCGTALTALKAEMEKLGAYVGAGGEITPDAVRTLATATTEWKTYQLSDALFEGRAGEAHGMIRDMLREGENRFGLMAGITRSARQLYHARLLLDAGREREAAAELEIAPFIARRLVNNARVHSAADLEGIVNALTEAEYAIKSGAMPEKGAWDAVIGRISEVMIND